MSLLLVALGGALGAMGRYAISLIPVRSAFPILTLVINILGAIAIGFIAGLVTSGITFLQIQCCFGRPVPAAALPLSQPFRWRHSICGRRKLIPLRGCMFC